MKRFKLIATLLVIKTVVLLVVLAVISYGGAGGSASSAATAAAGPSSNVLCSAPGVIKCVDFDTAADLAGKDGDVSGISSGDATPEIDFKIKASGNGSLKFTIPSKSKADSSGYYFTNFSSNLATQFGENSEFYVQWKQRFSPEFLNTAYAGGDGWKQFIIGTGDQRGKPYYACTDLEVVTENEFYRGFAQMYNSCSGSTSHHSFDDFYQKLSEGDLKLQNARPSPYCLYSQSRTKPITFFPPAGNCIGYFPDEWMTFQIHVKTGPRMNDEFANSSVQLWIAREGKPAELAIDWGPYNLTAGDPKANQKFGKVFLLPYNTKKDPSVSYPVAYTWYDDLVISTQPIGDVAGRTGSSARSSAK